MTNKRPTTSSANKLSPEVIGLVLDTVSNDKNERDAVIIQTLTTCRLLSRLFHSLATPRVFKEVHLHCFGWRYREHSKGDAAAERYSKKFLVRLEANPSIAGHVRVLKLTSRLGSRSWLGKSKSLPQILPKLVNLQHISIEVFNGSVTWQDVRADVAKAYQTAFQLPSIRTLEVMNIEGFLLDPLLAGAPVPHTTELIASSSAPASSCGIDSLILCAGTLRYCRLTPHAVSGTQNLAYTIKKLKLSFKTEYGSVGSFTDLATPWKDLMTRLSNGLREVEISDRNTDHKPELWPSGDDLSSLTRLESLTLLGNMSPEKFNINFPPGFARTLQSHKAVPSIQTGSTASNAEFTIPNGKLYSHWRQRRDENFGGYEEAFPRRTFEHQNGVAVCHCEGRHFWGM